jgi:hypothetical protein
MNRKRRAEYVNDKRHKSVDGVSVVWQFANAGSEACGHLNVHARRRRRRGGCDVLNGTNYKLWKTVSFNCSLGMTVYYSGIQT